MDLVQPQGVGELQLKLEQLKLKLEKEGLFEPARKRPLPAFPKKVGVITSPSGAVWQDIQTVMRRRYPLVELVLAPTAVQGEEAISGIVEAFYTLNQLPDIDVVILARGGGSLEDLWAFNEEAVARAIFKSRAPVISAVGHETDFTIADLVSDCRAPTPSAAAEMAAPDRVELAARVIGCRQALFSHLSSLVAERSDGLSSIVPRLRRCRPDLDGLRMRLDDLLRHASKHLKSYLKVKHDQCEGYKARLIALSPSETLRRGYAIIQIGASLDVVSDVEQVTTGDTVHVTLARGGFEAEVLPIREEDAAAG